VTTSRVTTGAVVGIDGHLVTVECSRARGASGLTIIGLREAAERETRIRVRSALAQCGVEPSAPGIDVNVTGAQRGSACDLAVALAIVALDDATVREQLAHTLVLGELALSGELRVVRGVYAILRDNVAINGRVILPWSNASEAHDMASTLDVRPARNLSEVLAYLRGKGDLARLTAPDSLPELRDEPDLADVRGQHAAVRALEIAATGGHHLLLVGAPGAGKTMLARRVPELLPPLPSYLASSIQQIGSAAGFEPRGPTRRPFRAPHYTASEIAMVGGGDPVRPGELTLAHGGVLMLDELPEWRRTVLDATHRVIESGEARVQRKGELVTMYARPLVVGAMNACPCGFQGDPTRVCACTSERVAAYRERIARILPLFSMAVRLQPTSLADLRGPKGDTSSADVRARVTAAREYAVKRGGHDPDATVRPSDLRATLGTLSGLNAPARTLLSRATDAGTVDTATSRHVLAVARTIADLAAAPEIGAEHLAEALNLTVRAALGS
jgi:magnesium chelatase family protein